MELFDKDDFQTLETYPLESPNTISPPGLFSHFRARFESGQIVRIIQSENKQAK